MFRLIAGGVFCTALALPATAQNDPFVDLLNRRGYDRDAILRQFPANTPPPDDSTADDSPAANPGQAPTFRPAQIQPAGGGGSAEQLALILPTQAGGLAGQAAIIFHRGCLHGIRNSRRTAEVKLYPGTGATAADSYAAAAAAGAQVIVGPMLKSTVRRLLARYPQAPVPTLLLQPASAAGYSVMTLDTAQEAADLARLLHQRGAQNIWLVEENTPRGERQRAAFEQAWTILGGAIPRRFSVRNAGHDWPRLFKLLKETKDDFLIYAAGSSDFARQVRNFVPQRHPVFAASIVNDGAQTAAALLVENISFMEMPWFVGLDERRAIFDSPAIRALPLVRQRFFALGADACRAALDQPRWTEGWTVTGLSGDWHLQDGVFQRDGMLVGYRAGQLRRLPQ